MAQCGRIIIKLQVQAGKVYGATEGIQVPGRLKLVATGGVYTG